MQDPEESKGLDHDPRPKIIIAGSGMATGGRALHHLKVYAPGRENMIMFTGFQAGGTRGAAITGGAEQVKIHGQYWPIRAEAVNLEMLSAHADGEEIIDWLSTMESHPRGTFIVHGEPDASDTLRLRIAERLAWPVTVPDNDQMVEL